ncbi:MAG: hypothetical protein H7099_09230 [Gemmatimonadaceae bacterium]|nr:hypothetical protein [Gemmatimonadaceae bacterium]
MTETQERFLRTVLTRVPVDSVVELHLFPPIRRGTLETGVAFIATTMPPAVLTVVLDTDAEALGDADLQGVDAREVDVTTVTEPLVLELSGEADSPYADERVVPAVSDDTGLEDDDIAPAEVAPVATPSPRMRILTASYRHTIKGVERGKWSVEVQEEADAPLDAVEAVLRGVRHRSTEPADPELVGHDVLAALTARSAVAPAA